MQHLQPIMGAISEIRNGGAVVHDGETVRTFSLAWYRIPCQEQSSVERHVERCDTCGRPLDQMSGEDFFVEDIEGAHVYCEAHWPGGGDAA